MVGGVSRELLWVAARAERNRFREKDVIFELSGKDVIFERDLLRIAN